MSRTYKDKPARYQDGWRVDERHFWCQFDNSPDNNGRLVEVIKHPAKYSEPKWHNRRYVKIVEFLNGTEVVVDEVAEDSLSASDRAMVGKTRKKFFPRATYVPMQPSTKWEFGPVELQPPRFEKVYRVVECDIDDRSYRGCVRGIYKHQCYFPKGSKAAVWHTRTRAKSRDTLRNAARQYNTYGEAEDFEEFYEPPNAHHIWGGGYID